MIKRFRIWYAAHFEGAEYFRVTYPDGKRTRPLRIDHATSLRDCFGGEIWIDYEYAMVRI
jgi:hypothetical protein